MQMIEYKVLFIECDFIILTGPFSLVIHDNATGNIDRSNQNFGPCLSFLQADS